MAEAAARRWWQTKSAVWAGALLLPPAGLILLWARAKPRLLAKVFLTIPILILGLLHLIFVYGMRLESEGSGFPTLVTFEKKEDRFAAVERSREEQKQEETKSQKDKESKGKEIPAAASEPSAAATAPKAAAYWTDYRGPRRDGSYAERPVLAVWPAEGLKPLWRQPVGEGYASIVVAQGLAFTIEQRRNKEVVAAYELLTGREVWTNSWPGDFRESMGGDGPRATPTWHDGRLYALGAEGELRCIDAASGKTIWSKNILTDNGASNITWGMAASPLVVDDKVIVQPGGSGSSVVAYHRLTGERMWGALDDKPAYVAAMAVTLAGQRQILTVTADRAVGLTVEEGKLLWSFPWQTEYDVNAAQPIMVDEDHFYISSGYGHGAALVHISREGETFAANAVWQSIEMKNRFNSAVLFEGHIYGFDESIFSCLDVKTGKRKWKGGRYGYGQVLVAGDRLIVLTEQGDLVLLRATPERHEELARFSAIEGKTWNVPAIADGILLVRNLREMAAFRIQQ
jgi:outer membrane protein assembly factor BamB